ncbi:MAG: hypothetical protein P4L59_18685 [Desulfosporosinus sp.]|nr:hypothetical protein [Desulfosporosinus sp.]
MKFNVHGLLDPGDHLFTFAQLRQSILVQGPPDEIDWDFRWRAYLVDNLEIMVKQLWDVGILSNIYYSGRMNIK